MVTLALFFPFSGQKTYQSYYQFLMTHHKQDFSRLPDYPAFVASINTVAPFCYVLCHTLTGFFRENTLPNMIKFADSTRLKVCENQRITEHKVAKRKIGESPESLRAGRGKSSR